MQYINIIRSHVFTTMLTQNSAPTNGTTVATNFGQDDIMNISKLISDYGATVILAAVGIIFLVKVLNTFLEKDKAVTNSIIPGLTEIRNTIANLKVTVVETISSHNTASNKKLTEVKTEINAVQKAFDKADANLTENVKKLDDRVDALTEQLTRIDAKLDIVINMATDKRDNK